MTLRQNLTIRQGETWSFRYTHLDGDGAAIDLTGYAARMAIRDQVGGTLEAYLSSEAGEQDGGSIALGGAAGTVDLAMSALQTKRLTDNLASASILIDPERRNRREETFVYDLEIVSGSGVVTRAIEGIVTVSREVTE